MSDPVKCLECHEPLGSNPKFCPWCRANPPAPPVAAGDEARGTEVTFPTEAGPVVEDCGGNLCRSTVGCACALNAEMICLIREITDVNGADSVPFLDDAVRAALSAAREQGRAEAEEALGAKLSAIVDAAVKNGQCLLCNHSLGPYRCWQRSDMPHGEFCGKSEGHPGPHGDFMTGYGWEQSPPPDGKTLCGHGWDRRCSLLANHAGPHDLPPKAHGSACPLLALARPSADAREEKP